MAAPGLHPHSLWSWGKVALRIMSKETFIIRTEWWGAISQLEKEDRATILDNLFHYHMDEENLINLNNLNVILVWKFIEPSLSRHIELYDKRKLTSGENGKLGGRPPKVQIVIPEPQKPKKPNSKPNNLNNPVLVPVLVPVKENTEPAELHPLQKWINETCPRIVKAFPQQLTYEQAEKLVKDFDKTVLKKTIENMENRKTLNYVNVNKTLRNWLSKVDSTPGISQNGQSNGLMVDPKFLPPTK